VDEGAPHDGQNCSLTFTLFPQYTQARDFKPVPHCGHQSYEDNTCVLQFGQIACETATGLA
jgi:hypothetical protein